MPSSLLHGCALALCLVLSACGGGGGGGNGNNNLGNTGGGGGAINPPPTAVNQAPVARDDDAVVALSGTSIIDVLANDTDAEGGVLSVELVAQPPGAHAMVDGGRIHITPDAGMSGPTRLEYRVRDTDGGTATARVRVVFGSMQPIFIRSAHNSGEQSIRRYDYFSNRKLNTPVPANATIIGFIVSADASTMVYISDERVHPLDPGVRLWLKNLTDDAAPVREILLGSDFRTSAIFLADSIAISPDGSYIVIDDRYVRASRPDQPILLASGVERPQFSQDGRYLYYAVGPFRADKAVYRAEVNPEQGIINETRITGYYGGGYLGMGAMYALTADEAHVVSSGLVAPLPQARTEAYVSPVNGPPNDVRLHPQLTAEGDTVSDVGVTSDGRYVYYTATINAAQGVYFTDLQSPGTSTRLNVNPPFAGAPVTAQANMLLYSRVDSGGATTWFYTTFSQPSIAMTFAPLGASQTQFGTIVPATDGALVFTANGQAYVTDPPYTTAKALQPGLAPFEHPELRYTPGSNILVIRGTGFVKPMFVLNAKAPGWYDRLDGQDPLESLHCTVIPGQRCDDI